MRCELKKTTTPKIPHVKNFPGSKAISIKCIYSTGTIFRISHMFQAPHPGQESDSILSRSSHFSQTAYILSTGHARQLATLTSPLA